MRQLRNNKNLFLAGKLGEPSRVEGGSVLGTIAMTVGDIALEKGVPFLAKKGFEAGCYYMSEALWNPNLQKKAIDFTLAKAHPLLQKVGRETLDQLSTKVRANRCYKTDRTDLDRARFDVHAALGKLPKPKRGWTLPGHNFTGPYNPLEQQVDYDPETGQILQIHQQPTGITDSVALQHDVDYGICSYRNTKYGENEQKYKHTADKKMVKALDAVPQETKAVGARGGEERDQFETEA